MSTKQKASQAAHQTEERYKRGSIFTFLNPFILYTLLFQELYILFQRIIIFIFKPRLPTWQEKGIKPKGRVAVIGAGLTGISSAA